jgi:hypothetical protein
MKIRRSKSACSLARLLISSGIVLALLCVAAANSVEHFHRDAESAANCRICQIAHVPIAPMSARVVLPAPSWTAAERPGGPASFYFTPVLLHSPSRAPPF